MLLRPLLTAVLCCVVAFGHAPAWLHLATCGKTSSGVGEGCETIVGGHCCCKHTNPFAGRSVSKGASASSKVSPKVNADESMNSRLVGELVPVTDLPIDGHSSDDCVICHSLMSAVGQVDLGPIKSVAQDSVFLDSVGPSNRLSDGVSSTMHLRGPPVS
ncbi:MAG TPA: hypothetical protein DDZ51_18030 [Planctomycetaceae bacterium]|nr:hypothetical protein [Planctomycetaceae bacterium]